MIGSVHSHMNLESAEMTDRLLRALECPSLRVLGHPTGRILLHRDAVSVRFRARGRRSRAPRRVARNQRQPGAAGPERAPLIRTAKAQGARFIISTDAHHPKHLANMRYGVITARRGWLGPADVMNTLPRGQVRRGHCAVTDHENHLFA